MRYPNGMKRLRRLRRSFTRRFGYARLICLVLLVSFAVLRHYDPPAGDGFVFKPDLGAGSFSGPMPSPTQLDQFGFAELSVHHDFHLG
jgi:hypothetical protein